MYTGDRYYVHMIKRTTIEIDEALLAQAKKALGAKTTRATVEEALRLAAHAAEGAHAARATGQRGYFERLGNHADLKVLGSEEMWQ
jgi:Arc/MetJ family transcription regulator